MHVIVRRLNFLTQFWKRWISIENLRNFWLSYRQWKLIYISFRQFNRATQQFNWQTRMNLFKKSRFQTSHWKSFILNLVGTLPGSFSYLLTTTSLLTIPIYYRPQNAQRSDQYSVQKINPDIHLMCKLHVIVKLCRAACRDADWHFMAELEEFVFVQFVSCL
jgi:hypothetical protein